MDLHPLLVEYEDRVQQLSEDAMRDGMVSLAIALKKYDKFLNTTFDLYERVSVFENYGVLTISVKRASHFSMICRYRNGSLLGFGEAMLIGIVKEVAALVGLSISPSYHPSEAALDTYLDVRS